MQPLERFCKKHKLPPIWVKRDDLTDAAASGNKLRKLEFNVAEALSQGATALITCGGIQSNHCRATAIVAASLGLTCHLVLRGAPSEIADGNLLLDQLVGAEITYLPSQGYNDRLPAAVAKIQEMYAQQNSLAFSIPLGASDETGLWGYITACEELKQDFIRHSLSPDYIVSATGSGGTAAGLIVGNAAYDLGAEVLSINVCNDEAYFVKKIKGDLARWQTRYQQKEFALSLPIQIIDGYVGPGYGLANDEIYETISDLARTEGIILDPVYTGKAFHGLVAELKSGRLKPKNEVVFIHTGGIFGLFPHREHF
jgi:D-cysteine desulfhydrase